MDKKEYTSPEIEMIIFTANDIITKSPPETPEEGFPDD